MALAGIEHGNIGGLVAPATVAQALGALTPNAERLQELRDKGLQLVAQPQFRWAAIAERFFTVCHLVLDGQAHTIEATEPKTPGSPQSVETEGVIA
jgi:hypothetical protein